MTAVWSAAETGAGQRGFSILLTLGNHMIDPNHNRACELSEAKYE